MKVSDDDVETAEQVFEVLAQAKAEGRKEVTMLMAHSELKDGLTCDDIPQISVDQLNTRLVLATECLDRQKSSLIATGGVYQYVFSKLTRGNESLTTRTQIAWTTQHLGCLTPVPRLRI